MTSTKRIALTGFTLILLYILGFLIFWFFNFQRVVVKGESMLPTFEDGDVLWACKAYWLIGPIQQKDIVVVRLPDQDAYIIKRAHRLPGERVEFPNLPEDYSIRSGPYQVPEGHLYVLGDNRRMSADSRSFGPVPMHQVVGKVVFLTWWSVLLALVPVFLVVYIFVSVAFPQPRVEHEAA